MTVNPRFACAIALVTSALSFPVYSAEPFTTESTTGQSTTIEQVKNPVVVSIEPNTGDIDQPDTPWNVSSVTTDLYDFSGLKSQIADFPTTFLDAFDASYEQFVEQSGIGDDAPESVHDAIKSAVHGAFDAEQFEQQMLETIEASLTLEQILATTEWYKQPLGEKIVAMEVYSSSLEGVYQRAEFLSTLDEEESVPEGRRAALQRLDETVGITRTAVSINNDMQLAMVVVMSAMMPEQLRPDMQEIKDTMKAAEPDITKQFQSMVADSLLFTYHDLSQQGLETYIRFAATDEAQQFNKAATKGLTRALVEVSMRMGAGIHEVISEASQRHSL